MLTQFKQALKAKTLSLMGLVLMCVHLSGCNAASESKNYHAAGNAVNDAVAYPVNWATQALNCDVDLDKSLGQINPHIFGTNLEWFNDAGGLASQDKALQAHIVELTKQQGVTVMRYPGGTLADFYHWKNGTGPIAKRPKIKHPTDPGTSSNAFGTPEFDQFLKATQSEALITVNAGTGTAQEAAEWVAYANQGKNPLRLQDGMTAPMNVKLWEIGNELYFTGNPGEQMIGLTPEVYAQRYLEFSRAMKAVDPSIKTIAIGVADAHIGPTTPYKNWTEVLLEKAGSEIDMIAVHNAYFPMLYTERQPHVLDVYPSLLAAPEAVDRSLTQLEQRIDHYQPTRKIGIAITEWGMLFSAPNVDNYWLDHVKTLGSGIYAARMLQVMMAHPRVELANYFKLVDRSYMGWINFEGKPKVPYWVFALYANNTGGERINAKVDSPRYDAKQIGIIAAEKQVPEVTVVASKDSANGKLYINLVNRSINTGYPVKININALAKLPNQEKLTSKELKAKLLRIAAKELTAHNGRDIPPEWPYALSAEPYTTAASDSINIEELDWDIAKPVQLAPFSVVTVVVDIHNI